MALETIDIIFILAYFLIVLIIGLRAYFKETREEFLIGGRKLNLLSNASTITANKIGAGLIIVFLSFVFLYGFQAVFMTLGAVVGFLLFLIFARKLKQKADKEKFYTLADYFKSKQGKHVGYLAAVTSLITMALLFFLQLIGAGKIVSEILGISYYWSLFVIIIPIAIYIYLGGFKSEVDTDFMQNIAIIIIFLVLTVFFFINIPLLQDFTFQSFSIMTIIGFFILGLVTPFGSMELWQRVYSAKDKKTLTKSILLAIILLIIVSILLLLIGFQLKSLIPSISDPDLLLIRGFDILPTGLFGLGIIALFAAIMSSADTYLFSTSAVLVQDFIFKKKFSLRKFRAVILLVSLVGLIFSIFIQDLPNATLLFASYASIIAAILLLSYIKESKMGAIIGFYFGLIGTTALAFMGIDSSLIIKSIGITLIGYLIGGFYRAIFKK